MNIAVKKIPADYKHPSGIQALPWGIYVDGELISTEASEQEAWERIYKAGL